MKATDKRKERKKHEMKYQIPAPSTPRVIKIDPKITLTNDINVIQIYSID